MLLNKESFYLVKYEFRLPFLGSQVIYTTQKGEVKHEFEDILPCKMTVEYFGRFSISLEGLSLRFGEMPLASSYSAQDAILGHILSVGWIDSSM